MNVENWHAAHDFLCQEAALLDTARFDEWLALFDADAEYWVPMLWGQKSPRDHVSLIYEDKRLLTMRIIRLQHEATMSQAPASRTTHHVTNVRVVDAGAAWTVESALLFMEYRRGEERSFSGRVTHVLRPENGSFRIRSKRVDLINADQDSGHIRFAVPF